MKRVRIKVCGMKKADQVERLVEYGVDAIGMIFYEKSPRKIELEEAIAIRKVVPAFVSLVGVFVNESPGIVKQIVEQAGLDLVQLHGDEIADYAKELNVPYLRAIRVESSDTIEREMSAHQQNHQSRGFLLDTFSKDGYGGTGHRIDESLLPNKLDKNVILAGGINPDNIQEVLALSPYAVDINSGVENAPGDKNLEQVKRIIAAVREQR